MTAELRSAIASRKGFTSRTPRRRAARSIDARTPRAVVVGLDCATGLQTARILRSRGIPVVGVAGNRRHPCIRSRVCERLVIADTAGPELVQALVRLGADLSSRAVLFPCTDMSVLVTSANRAALEVSYHVMLPPAETVDMLVQKDRFADFAQRAGLPVPVTMLLHGRKDAELAARTLRFPVALKPSVKTPQWERNTTAKLFKVENASEMMAAFERCGGWTSNLIAQEWIPGDDREHFTCNAYFGRDGEPLAMLTTRKLRQWPITGGQACLSVTVRDTAVEDTTVRVFQLAGHRGLAYLEMKRDTRSGEYLIVEPNVGRPTGRSATAEAVGVELLYAMYCDALGWPLPAPRVQDAREVKWIYLRRDVLAALSHWRRGELGAREWVGSLRGPMIEALFSWTDPLPFVADLAGAVAARLRRRGAPAEKAASR